MMIIETVISGTIISSEFSLAVSVLLHDCTNWTLMTRLQKKDLWPEISES